MSEDLAMTLLEELINSQSNLISELNDLTLQIEISDTVEIKRSANSCVLN